MPRTLEKGLRKRTDGWWSWLERKVVHEFLESSIYLILCGAVPKGADPHGRVIHDYSFAAYATGSLNWCLLDNSVSLILSPGGSLLADSQGVQLFLLMFYFGLGNEL